MLAVLVLGSFAAAQSVGPDVIVGDVTGPSSYSPLGGIYAYSLGTTSCNIGTVPLEWISNQNRHPVIGQNIYRVSPSGRFEMIGMSFLKHGFTALAQSLCATCQNPGTGSLLGVNCSDPYGSGLNGQQSGLGPRFEVNAATGAYPYPFTSLTTGTSIARRLQCTSADVDPALNPGAIYFGEGQYIAPDDSAAGNDNNNVSYRRMSFAAGTFVASFTASTVRMKSAIEGWQDLDPSVQLTIIDVPSDGRMILGRKAVDLGGGNTRFEYALYNMNSHRSASRIAFTMPPGTNVSNLYFHDVPYHSGEPFNSIDWAPSFNGTEVAFACTETYAANQNANALRWGTAYNVSFQASAAPGSIRIDLFRPGSPSFVSIGPVFALDFTTLGAGAGNLHLGVDNIPATTFEGFCLFSLSTALPVGNGPLLGLTPDTLTIACLTTSRSPGNIFHWEMPSPGLFPTADLNLPIGSVPFPAGTNVDGVAFAISSIGGYLGATVPVRVVF